MIRPILMIGFVFLFLIGCNHGPETFPVNGTVTFAGKPLDEGAIIFVPAGSNKNVTIPSEALIRDGTYQIDKKYGITQGSYTITVESMITIPPSSPNGEIGYRPRFQAYSIQHTFEMGNKNYIVDIDIPQKSR